MPIPIMLNVSFHDVIFDETPWIILFLCLVESFGASLNFL